MMALNGGEGVRIRHVPKWLAGLIGIVTPGLSRALVEIRCSDSTGHSSKAAAAWQLTLTDIEELWKRKR